MRYLILALAALMLVPAVSFAEEGGGNWTGNVNLFFVKWRQRDRGRKRWDC